MQKIKINDKGFRFLIYVDGRKSPYDVETYDRQTAEVMAKDIANRNHGKTVTLVQEKVLLFVEA